MQRGLPLVLSVAVVWAAAGLAAAQESVPSGPQKGEMLPGSFHPYNATGEHRDRPHCLVCEYGLSPVVAVFTRDVPAPDRPVAKLLQALDEAVEKNKALGLRAFAVVLTDAADNVDARKAAAQRLRDFAEAAKLRNVVLSLDTAAGPKDYKLSPDAEVTVLVYSRHKVEANFAYRKGAFNEEDTKAILAAALPKKG